MAKVRNVPFEITTEEFQDIANLLVGRIIQLFDDFREKKVTGGDSVAEVRNSLARFKLQDEGINQKDLIDEISRELLERSLFNGHPKFMGYITSSPTPIGILSDLLASTINPNVGGWDLSPVASEIEKQAIQWIAELIGYHSDCGGLLVSGGNMANIVPFFAARRARANEDLRENGWDGRKYRAYCSAETHTWIQKAADMSGMGTNAIRWIPSDEHQKMRTDLLESTIQKDLDAGFIPFMVVGTAGTVSTGALDPLRDIWSIARKYELWFHVDGAYGAPVAALPGAHPDFEAMREADSIALDPHKWLYSPLEAGCVLVREKSMLVDAFGYRPAYYDFSSEDEDPINYYELGPQNSRGFRALKVWTALLAAGKRGYQEMISDDIRLAEMLALELENHPRFQVYAQNMSITAFRYIPEGREDDESYLDQFNRKLLKVIQRSGELFLSNAMIGERFLLRTCIVNFRTQEEDIAAIPAIIHRLADSVSIED